MEKIDVRLFFFFFKRHVRLRRKKRRLKTLLGSKRKYKCLVNKSLIIKTMDTVMFKKKKTY